MVLLTNDIYRHPKLYPNIPIRDEKSYNQLVPFGSIICDYQAYYPDRVLLEEDMNKAIRNQDVAVINQIFALYRLRKSNDPDHNVDHWAMEEALKAGNYEILQLVISNVDRLDEEYLDMSLRYFSVSYKHLFVLVMYGIDIVRLCRNQENESKLIEDLRNMVKDYKRDVGCMLGNATCDSVATNILSYLPFNDRIHVRFLHGRKERNRDREQSRDEDRNQQNEVEDCKDSEGQNRNEDHEDHEENVEDNKQNRDEESKDDEDRDEEIKRDNEQNRDDEDGMGDIEYRDEENKRDDMEDDTYLIDGDEVITKGHIILRYPPLQYIYDICFGFECHKRTHLRDDLYDNSIDVSHTRESLD